MPNSLFAVSTPGGEELHHPHVITLQHHLVKVVVGELNHILLTATATLLLERFECYLTIFREVFDLYFFKLMQQKASARVHWLIYLFVVAGSAGFAAQPLFHQRAQSIHGSVHDGLATAST